MSRPARISRPILVVEDQAHLEYGHYPRGCANLARALTALGCDVRVLTSRGWVGGDGDPGGFRVERFGRAAAAVWSMADALAPSLPRTHWTRRARWSAHVSAAFRAMSVASATRRAVRRSAGAAPDVVLYAHDVHTFVLAALVGPGRFVAHAFRPPSSDRPQTFVGRMVDGRARRSEAARRHVGGGFRVAAATPSLVDAWRRRAPFLDPVLIVHGMSSDEEPVDDARATFGLASDARVALVFGADHGNKDFDCVWRAFVDLPDWTLLVVGHVADAFRVWAADHDAPAAVVVGGFVDDRVRASAYSAADLVVLSYEPGHVRDSGVLQDALAFHRPVVCSSGSDPADRVVQCGLGTVFEAGEPDALVAAVRAAPRALSEAAVARARESTSDGAVARAHLDALDALAPQGERDEADEEDQAGRK